MKRIITDEVIKAVAESIIYSKLDDHDYLGVTEMIDDYFRYGGGEDYKHIYVKDDEKIWRQVDEMLSKARITITFED